MIRSWGHDTARDIWTGVDSKSARRIPRELWTRTVMTLELLDGAMSLHDMKGVSRKLEALRGEQRGRHAIRVNQQYRITFRWHEGDAHEVRVEDYH
jgi:proteic killer suppression protein